MRSFALSRLTIAASIAISVGWLGMGSFAAYGQQLQMFIREFDGETSFPEFPPEQPVAAAPPPPPPPPPLPPPPPPALPFVPPPRTFTPPVVVPTDVTRANNWVYTKDSLGVGPVAPTDPSRGMLVEHQFPKPEDVGGPTDFILVRAADGADFERRTPYAVKLQKGTILVSLRKPSRIGMIDTAIGKVAIYANGDSLLHFEDGTLRVMNIDGMGRSCRISLSGHTFAKLPKKIFSLKPGFEIIASDHHLKAQELRPPDGVSRKQTKFIEGHQLAISQFSVDSLLKGCQLIADMAHQDSGAKERRVIADISKMAAVLNQVEGYQGFHYTRKDLKTPPTNTQVADKPGAGPL